ncbi:hypothetical protein RRG08_028856 [Elysia crispata]|uniref:Uncharacterized protein n=1 Tax=Elysia crispata TaxID=231223 RepID=A0AAE1D734_9GAST|nr:hypothetical protein RRG08_028856 [Elysia crispata]
MYELSDKLEAWLVVQLSPTQFCLGQARGQVGSEGSGQPRVGAGVTPSEDPRQGLQGRNRPPGLRSGGAEVLLDFTQEPAVKNSSRMSSLERAILKIE